MNATISYNTTLLSTRFGSSSMQARDLNTCVVLLLRQILWESISANQ